MTKPGREVLKIAEVIFSSVSDIEENPGNDYTGDEGGKLIVATTHTFARYVLPQVVENVLQEHPGVQPRSDARQSDRDLQNSSRRGMPISRLAPPA